MKNVRNDQSISRDCFLDKTMDDVRNWGENANVGLTQENTDVEVRT